ncbi:ABC transporter substrate-binding protein [Verminephrobacter aporrectodeae subsp. tuberculatae]|nr:ABC transporter substrate-binding protein [Verminephrobacter aporrectodeae subsp. tuberculatae]MCW8167618.1 ABC transporter substrate-binding protein [Verminephrobacter aporrectodeae subsp. tuberculatae]
MKKHMKSIASALLGLTLGLGASAANAQQTLRIGVEGEYAPFNEVDKNGKLKGFDVDIANALCDEMQVKCSFVIQTWDGIIPALISNKYEMIVSSVSMTEKRKAVVAFSKPYYKEHAVFVGPKGKEMAIDGDGLKGKTIGVQTASAYEKMLKEKFPAATAKSYPAVPDHNLDLNNGRLDAVLAARLPMLDWLKTRDGKNFEVKGQAFKDAKYMGEGAGIALRKGDTALMNKVNAALDNILKNGKYDAINNQYFPVSIRP